MGYWRACMCVCNTPNNQGPHLRAGVHKGEKKKLEQQKSEQKKNRKSITTEHEDLQCECSLTDYWCTPCSEMGLPAASHSVLSVSCLHVVDVCRAAILQAIMLSSDLCYCPVCVLKLNKWALWVRLQLQCFSVTCIWPFNVRSVYLSMISLRLQTGGLLHRVLLHFWARQNFCR